MFENLDHVLILILEHALRNIDEVSRLQVFFRFGFLLVLDFVDVDVNDFLNAIFVLPDDTDRAKRGKLGKAMGLDQGLEYGHAFIEIIGSWSGYLSHEINLLCLHWNNDDVLRFNWYVVRKVRSLIKILDRKGSGFVVSD